MKENGKIPVISANVNEVFGMIDKEIITDYSMPYILWGIDGDWNVCYREQGNKFYPTDHCGYIKILDNNINSIYFSKALEIEGNKQRFSRSNRASIDRVSSLIIRLPNIEIQNRVSKKVKELSIKIKRLEKELNFLDNKKKEIIDRYLN